MSRSAGINFGLPESEYRLRVDDTGAATSCYNMDTNTEYIGGGGGGSDFEKINATIRAGIVSNEMAFLGLSDAIFAIGGCDWETAMYRIDFTTVNGIATISAIGKNGKAHISSTSDVDHAFVPAEILNQFSGLPADFIVSGATFGEYDIEITDGANLVILSIGNV